MEDLDHRHVHDASGIENSRGGRRKPIALRNPCFAKPWVTIGLRFPATPKPGVAILGHPRDVYFAPLVTRRTHAFEAMGAAGKTFCASLSCIAQKARWFASWQNPAVACDGPVFHASPHNFSDPPFSLRVECRAPSFVIHEVSSQPDAIPLTDDRNRAL